jgi:hypothetical protein
VDFGDRRVLAGVHYPSDNVGSWITAMLICEHVCADGGRLGREFLWRSISTKSMVYAAIAQAIARNEAEDHKPAIALLNELGARPGMGIDDALGWAKEYTKPKPESLTLAAE